MASHSWSLRELQPIFAELPVEHKKKSIYHRVSSKRFTSQNVLGDQYTIGQ
jgi:hypothetical protein